MEVCVSVFCQIIDKTSHQDLSIKRLGVLRVFDKFATSFFPIPFLNYFALHYKKTFLHMFPLKRIKVRVILSSYFSPYWRKQKPNGDLQLVGKLNYLLVWCDYLILYFLYRLCGKTFNLADLKVLRSFK